MYQNVKFVKLWKFVKLFCTCKQTETHTPIFWSCCWFFSNWTWFGWTSSKELWIKWEQTCQLFINFMETNTGVKYHIWNFSHLSVTTNTSCQETVKVSSFPRCWKKLLVTLDPDAASLNTRSLSFSTRKWDRPERNKLQNHVHVCTHINELNIFKR